MACQNFVRKTGDRAGDKEGSTSSEAGSKKRTTRKVTSVIERGVYSCHHGRWLGGVLGGRVQTLQKKCKDQKKKTSGISGRFRGAKPTMRKIGRIKKKLSECGLVLHWSGNHNKERKIDSENDKPSKHFELVNLRGKS